MNFRIRITGCTLVLAAVAGTSAVAGVDDGLYAPAPPANSAFVRIINAKTDGAAVAGQLAQRKISAVGVGGASPYWALRAGTAKALLGSGAAALSLQPGKYYSVVVRGKTGAEKLATVLDPALTSKAKSLIILYNLTSKPTITLKTADGKAAVVTDVAPGKLGSRSVNAAKSGFVVASGSQTLATFPVQSIARGAAYSVVAVESNGKTKAEWLPSQTRVN